MREIPFRLKYGLLYLPVTLFHNGKELVMENCIFDTGSGGTVFDIDEVSKIGIHAAPHSSLKRLKTVGGHQTVFVASVNQLQLGHESMSEVKIEVGNLHSQFGVQGIVGTDVMQCFDWEMRFSDKRLVSKRMTG